MATPAPSQSVLEQKQADLDRMKINYMRLQKQYDDEVIKREKAEDDTATLERQVVDSEEGKFRVPVLKSDGADARQASSKIFRAIDHWMRYKDLEQALLRNSALSDIAFSTLAQMLQGCPSLHTLDLSRNQLTMDSCSNICQLITGLQHLTYVSVESNGFSLRSLGYFMTALMERDNIAEHATLDLFDFQSNDGIMIAMEESKPSAETLRLYPNLSEYINPLPQLLIATGSIIWRFLHDTGHPQVTGRSVQNMEFEEIDPASLQKMKVALSKILLLTDTADRKNKTYSADLVLFSAVKPAEAESPKEKKAVQLPPISKEKAKPKETEDWTPTVQPIKKRDPFKDLTAKLEGKPKVKCNTFNLKQILTKKNAILMNMLERLLETTSINARDVETHQTLLEYACHTGNMGLAKLCYRRGANMNEKTVDGNTPFNIAVKNRRYDLMEFLHLYGVKVNSTNEEGLTGLHVAASNNDIDAICRLIEWGAEVNLQDHKKRTPLHMASIGGHEKVAMLLLELGADINAKDEREFTAVAHAEANDRFKLMDRLVFLGGHGHGLQKAKSMGALPDTVKLKTAMGRSMGHLPVSVSTRKRTAIGRLGKHKS